jgi:hypothetical protein
MKVRITAALFTDKFSQIVFALAGVVLWAAMAMADGTLEIGKTYTVRGTGSLIYQFDKVLLRRGEEITIIERKERPESLEFGRFIYLIQRRSGETVQIRAFFLEEALRNGLILLSDKEPRPAFRSLITYERGEPEGYKNYKFGMTYEETRDFYHPFGDFGRKQNWPLSPDQMRAEEERLNLPFKDHIGAVSVTVSLGFLPAGPVKPESTLSSVSLSFEPNAYETLKEIFIERYGKPVSSQHEPYKTQGGAESINEILMWKGPHSFIYLSRFGNRITEGSARIGTKEGLEAFSKKRDQDIKEAAKGL